MRDLEKDLSLCQSAAQGLPEPMHPLTKHFVTSAIEGWPEAIQRAMAAEEQVKDLKSELAANAKVLAQQCDLAREAETKAMEAEARVKKLLDAPDGLKELVRTNNELQDELKAAQERVKELEGEIEALKWQLKKQDEAALRTLEIERDEKRIWKKRAKRGEKA